MVKYRVIHKLSAAVEALETSFADISATELSYLDGVTSDIQTQLNAKAPAAAPTFTGTVTLPATITAPLVEYADNAAALTAGLTAGRFYRTAGAVMVVI